jgi:uncharacterized protein YjbI with pentapeptide repeats
MGSSDLEHRSAEGPEPRSSGQAASPRQLARIVGAAVAGALAVVTLGLTLALWGLGLTGKISQSTSEVLDLVKLGFALVAGVGGTVGLVLAYQRHLIAVEAGQRERAKEAREDAKEAREEAKLFNERFGTAASQLASEQYAVKLAGVYAMAKLADDWDAGRQTCINVLCANLRRGFTPKPLGDTDPASLLPFEDNHEFRHTIIAVITTRLRIPDSPWQQCTFDFHGAVFDGGDFRGVAFTGGTVDFSNATFKDGTVDFRNAEFAGGTVMFDRARFTGGTVDFFDAKFTGGAVYFSGATFTRGTVRFDRARFTSRTVYFGEAEFNGGTVDFRHATFDGGTVDFYRAKFNGGTADFSYATFNGGTLDFRHATFNGGTDTSIIYLGEGTIHRGIVNFCGATFSDGTLDFSGATFSGGTVNFRTATFSGGIVDFSTVADFSVPPNFDFRPDAVSIGVLLPALSDPTGTS